MYGKRYSAMQRERVNYISTRGPKLEKRDIAVSISRLRILRASSISSRFSYYRSCAPLALVKRKGSIPRAGNSQRIMSTSLDNRLLRGCACDKKHILHNAR